MITKPDEKIYGDSAAIGGDIYKNREDKLPSAPSRIW